MPELSVVIPVSIYHKDIVARAVESVINQTVPCNVVTIMDEESRGAGWTRNQGLRQVNTEWVTFLDADDTIEPTFAETCFDILGRVQGNRYVYTNWYEGDTIKQAPSPCEVWTQQTYHLVTTLMRTVDVRRIGGYDEHMPGAEDTDFGIRLKLSGVCGIHLNVPLLHYRVGGRRSIELRASGTETHMLQYMKERYGGMTMGCCGDYEVPKSPVGEKQDGDVLAQAQWAGNDQKRGLHTGRLYPRASFPKVVYVDPLDVAAAPHMWKKVSAMPTSTSPVLQPGYQPQSTNWPTAGDAVFGGGQQVQPNTTQDWDYNPVTNERPKSDVLKIAQKKTK